MKCWLPVTLVVAMTLFTMVEGLADGDTDYERARMAVESGDAVPLATILEKVESLYEGTIMEVELEYEDDDGEDHIVNAFIYEIKMLTPQGNVLKLEMDARTMELLQVKGRGADLAKRGSAK